MSKKKLGEMARAAQPKKNKGHDDLTKLVLGGNGNVGAAIREAREQAAKRDAEATAQVVIGIMNAAQGQIEGHVAAIRRYRTQEKNELKKLREVQRAAQYAAETENYIPLALLTGSSLYDFGLDAEEDKDITTVPKDWQPAK